MSGPDRPAISLVAAISPLVVGAAHFNDALTRALRPRAELTVVSWRRMYPPLLYRAKEYESVPHGTEFVLDWANPWTWRRAAGIIERSGAKAVILPWLHPVMAPPYLYLLRRLRRLQRVVICHNVTLHEPRPGARWLTRHALERADLLVTHAPHQQAELADLGLADRPRLELFHPRFLAIDFAPFPELSAVDALRSSLGNPHLLLLCFGAVRPYKGFDLAIEALARLPEANRPSLVIAGRFWNGRKRYGRLIEDLGLASRVTLIDRYVANEEAATLFQASDAILLPYRTASQSGVAQLAFAYGKPVIATAVGGLPAAVEDGVDGLLCAANDPSALAGAIARFSGERARLGAGVEAHAAALSFDRYAERLLSALEDP